MIDQFTKGAWDIVIHGAKATCATVKGYRYRDFAVHRQWLRDGAGRAWNVTHLPSGLCLPFDFSTLANAAACAVDVDRVRNNWVGLDAEEVRAVRDRIVPICKRYGGKATVQSPVTERTYRRSLATPRNGYSAHA